MWGSNSERSGRLFHLQKPSRVAMGPTHTTIQWVRGSFPEVKRQRHAVDRSPPSIAGVENAFRYATFPHRLLWRAKERLYLFYSNIYPTRCNVTQFILFGNCSTYFGWYLHPSSGGSSNGVKNTRCCRYSCLRS